MIITASLSLFSAVPWYTAIDIEKISNFYVQRVVFQHIEKFTDPLKDGSYEGLMIIKDTKSYFLADGYDSIEDVLRRNTNLEIERKYADSESVWVNRINGKPDYMQINDRRNMIMKNASEEFVSTNFGGFYKSIRDKFIKEHVDKFRQLMKKRKEADIIVNKKIIPKSFYFENPGKEQDKFSILVKIKALDETVYTAEDSDGDGVTETFMVHGYDGFHWGHRSGPNLILIYKNTDKDIETLIGKLCNEAQYGTVEEEKEIIQTFPKEKDIADLIKFLTPPEPFIK
jgi:hypothetical protein